MTQKLKKYIALTLSSFAALLMLVFSDGARSGIVNGLYLTVDSVIPSLFLFTALSVMISKLVFITKPDKPRTDSKFGIKDAYLWILTAVSGYPVGAKIINGLYKDGTISRKKALKMITYSVNAGPAFIITTVGQYVFRSKSDGLRLFVCLMLSNLLLTVVANIIPDRFFDKQSHKKASISASQMFMSKHNESFAEIFTNSIVNAGQTMLTLSFFVVFFSGLSGILQSINIPFVYNLAKLSEVTIGIQSCKKSELTTAAFLLGFSGISVIFQVLSAAKDIKIPLSHLVFSRVAHGLLSSAITKASILLFPRSTATGNFNVSSINQTPPTRIFTVAAMVLLCIVLLDSGTRLYYNVSEANKRNVR